jgi:hypothetical protein
VSKETLPYATPANRPPASMASQMFGVIVRTVGLLLAVYGLFNLAIAITATIGMTYEGSPAAFVVYSVFWVGVGTALLRCDWLLRFAYGREA